MENKLGIFLCELRKENNLTQKDLAELVHVSPSTISKWEKGIAKPDVGVYDELAQVLNVSSVELFYCKRLEGDSTPQHLEALTDTMKELVHDDRQRNKKIFYQNIVGYVLAVLLAVSLVCNVYQYYTLSPRMTIVDEYYGKPPEMFPYENAYFLAVEYQGRFTDDAALEYQDLVRTRYKHHFKEAEVIIVTYYSNYKGRDYFNDYRTIVVIVPTGEGEGDR